MEDADLEMQQTMMKPFLDLSMDKVQKVVFRRLIGANPDTGGPVDVYVLNLTIAPDAFDKTNFGLVTADVKGYYNARTFYKPTYEGAKNTDKPDYRTTIHWEPNIITDKNGEATITFYNADPKTNVRIVVQGISNAGQPITGTASYIVK